MPSPWLTARFTGVEPAPCLVHRGRRAGWAELGADLLPAGYFPCSLKSLHWEDRRLPPVPLTLLYDSMRSAQEWHPGRLSLSQPPVLADLLGPVHVALQPPPRLAAYVLDDPGSRPAARSSSSFERFVDARPRSRRKSASVCSGSCSLRTSCGGGVGRVLTGRSRAGIVLGVGTEAGGCEPQPTVKDGPLGSKAGPPPWRYRLRELADAPDPYCRAPLGSGAPFPPAQPCAGSFLSPWSWLYAIDRSVSLASVNARYVHCSLLCSKGALR